MNKAYDDIMIISADVYLTIYSMYQKGIKAIRESSINRILYLAAVMYSFVNSQDENIFAKNYNFTITVSGPEDARIDNALINLSSNHVIDQETNGYHISDFEYSNSIKNYDNFDKKLQWIDIVSYIISIYGEEKIYDFVFRDPQYQNSFKKNDTHSLNLSNQNETVKFLEKFKEEFEKNLTEKNSIDNKRYLTLYFEYVFGNILRGDL